MKTRSIAEAMDTVTGAQLADLRILRFQMITMLADHPELAVEHSVRVMQGLIGEHGSLTKTVNDLRHVARQVYEADPLPSKPDWRYCERTKRPVDPKWWDDHKKECWMCDGREEGVHGTRQIATYVLPVKP